MSDIKKYNQEVQYQNRSIQNNGKKSVGKDIFTKSDETLKKTSVQVQEKRRSPFLMILLVAAVCIVIFHFLKESFISCTSAVSENNETQNTDVDYVIDWKDDIVEKRIREITGISSGDIRYSDVSNIQTLDLSDSTVKDISALSNLTNLEYLDLFCADEVSDISCLKNLTKLKYLSLRDTDVTDITPLKNLMQLNHLELSWTDISDISSLSNLTKLEYLDLSFSRVSDISALKNLSNLEYLNIAGCSIEDYSPIEGLQIDELFK